ncbi:HNH endonuclease [candidate division WOR-3 bacterium]|nr:HNH endonuclease [candidate division WOR-3 bacterium]
MAKRFTDTEIYNKKWFRELTPTEKCFWRYICDACNHAGIWEVDFETAGFFINKKLNESRLREIFKDRYVEIDNGKRWFIVGFIEFQYGKLSGGNPAHISVIKILNKHGIELEEMDIIRPIDKRMSVWVRDRGICLYCNKEIKGEKDFNVDHIIPKSQKGTDSYRNLASSCFKCNNKKSGKSIEEVGFIEPKVREYHIKKAYFDLENDVDLMIKFKGFFGKTKLPKVGKGCQHVEHVTPKDKDKDKDKDMDKDKDKDKDITKISQTIKERFEKFWEKYPRKLYKKATMPVFFEKIRTDKDWEKLKVALTNYNKSKDVEDGTIMNAYNWLENWEDWVNYKEPKKRTGKLTVEDL